MVLFNFSVVYQLEFYLALDFALVTLHAFNRKQEEVIKSDCLKINFQ